MRSLGLPFVNADLIVATLHAAAGVQYSYEGAMIAEAARRELVRRAGWRHRCASARPIPGKLLSAVILDHYGETLIELRAVGYLAYAKRQMSPYLRACVNQFSWQRRTLTQRLLHRVGVG